MNIPIIVINYIQRQGYFQNDKKHTIDTNRMSLIGSSIQNKLSTSVIKKNVEIVKQDNYKYKIKGQKSPHVLILHSSLDSLIENTKYDLLLYKLDTGEFRILYHEPSES